MRRPAPNLSHAPALYRSVLAAGQTVFLRDGYEASLNSVATEAGVSRQSVFNNFGSKEKLFQEIVQSLTSEAREWSLPEPGPDLRGALLAFARCYLAQVTSRKAIVLQRILLSGAPRLVNTMRAVHKKNYATVTAVLGNYLDSQVSAGRLRPVNTAFAAERFLSAVLGLDRIDIMLGVRPSRRQRDSYIEEAVDSFLHGIATQAA
jgi:TetR/AcrR family transcriptional regulator, mexJK operon transcriptional repressor